MLAAQYGTEDDFSRLRMEMEKLHEALGNHQQFIIHVTCFHLILAQSSGNPLYVLLLQALHVPLEKSMTADLFIHSISEHRKQIINAHQAILDKVFQRDAAGAREAMMAYLSSAIMH
ncbi:MAG TPA: FCD domain-containing protein [Buttiauxella sp.]|nr:FCD domain-containing protein [Buttiauxella sp.]